MITVPEPTRLNRWSLKVAFLARDLLACGGLYALLAYLGHPGWGGGAAWIGLIVTVGARLPFEYSPGNAGALGPHDG